MKKETPTQVFSYELYQVFKNFIVIEHIRGTTSYGMLSMLLMLLYGNYNHVMYR